MNRETLETGEVLSKHDARSSKEWLVAPNDLRKRSGYHLIALVGLPLIVAMCLLMQLDKLPQSSLSYSLLNGMVSVLFNFTSAALLKVSPFFISVLGLSKWFASTAR